MGIAALFARHLAFGIVVLALAHRARTQQRLVELGLCIGVQHANRICVLVPRFGARRYGRMGQLQLLQPFMGLGLAALLLQEHIHPSMLVVTVVAVLCVAGAKRFAH